MQYDTYCTYNMYDDITGGTWKMMVGTRYIQYGTAHLKYCAVSGAFNEEAFRLMTDPGKLCFFLFHTPPLSSHLINTALCITCLLSLPHIHHPFIYIFLHIEFKHCSLTQDAFNTLDHAKVETLYPPLSNNVDSSCWLHPCLSNAQHDCQQ